jgi:F0F1-type ATP synthase membrane subunit c/vacuolar-type H+-ATPase subunit K
MSFVCSANTNITGWKDMFFCISPYSWAYMGVALALGLSIIGAAWYAHNIVLIFYIGGYSSLEAA